MAFDVDSFLRETDQGTGTPPAPSMVREPRAKTDAEFGLDAGPIKVRVPGALERAVTGTSERGGFTPEEDAARKERREREDPVRNDPLAGAIVAGIPAAGAGALASEGAAALRASPLVARAAGGAVEGATASKEMGGDAGTGAALGAAAPLVGAAARKVGGAALEGAQKLVAGAEGRAVTRAQEALTEDVRANLRERITDPAALRRVNTVLASPEVRATATDPPKLLELSRKRLGELGDAAARGYEVLDKAAAGGKKGLTVVDVTEPLLKLRKSYVDESRDPQMVAAVDGLIDQFRGGIGKDPAKALKGADVRRWLTRDIQNPAFGVGDPRFDPPPRRAALQEAAGAIKDAIAGYAKRVGGDTAANTMQSLNDQITAYNLMERSAAERAAKIHQAPGPLKRAFDVAMHHKAEGAGALIGGHIAGAPGALVGYGVGHVAGKIPGAVDEALAQSPAAQRFAAAGVPTVAETPTAAASVPLAETQAQRDAKKRELAGIVFGGGQ